MPSPAPSPSPPATGPGGRYRARMTVRRGADGRPVLRVYNHNVLGRRAGWEARRRAPAGEHPWPAQVAATALGRFDAARADVALTLVELIVVEVRADSAWDCSAFRHILRFVRAHPELHPMEISPPWSPSPHAV